MNRIKQILPGLFMLLFLSLSGVEPGGILDSNALYEKAVPVLSPRAASASGGYEVILFFDVLSPDSGDCLRMLDGIPDVFLQQKIKVSALARNGKETVQNALNGFKPELLTVYANNADGSAFSRIAATEVLLPVAMIADSEGILKWKGAPSDLEDVLKQLITGTFSMQKQVQINLLRRELQGAVQAGLPQVILRTADQILEIEPADTIAVQAKLYVLEGQQRFDLAKDFLQKQIKKAPTDVKLRLMLLNLLTMNGDRAGYQTVLKQALNDMKYTYSAVTRILAFVLNNAPFGWIPLKETNLAAESLDKVQSKELLPPRVQAYRLEILARLAYYSMNIDHAVSCQQQAVNIFGSDSAKAMLQYYESVKALQKQ